MGQEDRACEFTFPLSNLFWQDCLLRQLSCPSLYLR